VESLRRNHLRDRQEDLFTRDSFATPTSRPSTRRSSSKREFGDNDYSTSRASASSARRCFQRIAKHSGRNKLIVAALHREPRALRQETIVFATDTLHAQTRRASFSTSSARRRKRLRRLLAQGLAGGHERVSRRGDADRPRERRDADRGFDAPKTRTVFIAPPHPLRGAPLADDRPRPSRAAAGGMPTRIVVTFLDTGRIRRSRHGVRRPGRTCRRAEAAAQHPKQLIPVSAELIARPTTSSRATSAAASQGSISACPTAGTSGRRSSPTTCSAARPRVREPARGLRGV